MNVGRPEPSYELRIVDHEGQPIVDHARHGELQVRGDWVMQAYLDRPDTTAAAFDADGWMHTGDLARRRPDGNLVLVARACEMYRSGGENVEPREVEQVLEAHPQVAVAAVVGIPDQLYGEVGAATVLPEPGASVSVNDLLAHARDHLGDHKVPKHVEVVSELPLLAVGKVDRAALRQRFAESDT